VHVEHEIVTLDESALSQFGLHSEFAPLKEGGAEWPSDSRQHRDPVYLARSLRTHRCRRGSKAREYDGCDKASHSITRAWNAKDLARGSQKRSRRAGRAGVKLSTRQKRDDALGHRAAQPLPADQCPVV
jgi:hypothetical protein